MKNRIGIISTVAMMAVDFDTDSGSVIGSPELLFEGIFHSPL